VSATDAGARVAGPDDAAALARMLHDFNTEFDFPSPGEEALTPRIADQIRQGHSTFLVIGSPPLGLTQLRFRESIWTGALDAYIEEFYVVPSERSRGLGRALLEATLDAARERGAATIEVGTARSDEAARHLYEALGFSNEERPGDPSTEMLLYELEL
jgi:GNAT superfamily N-acetyltransferase